MGWFRLRQLTSASIDPMTTSFRQCSPPPLHVQGYRTQKQLETRECIAYAESLRQEDGQFLTPQAAHVFREAARERRPNAGTNEDAGLVAATRAPESSGPEVKRSLKAVLHDAVCQGEDESVSGSGSGSGRSYFSCDSGFSAGDDDEDSGGRGSGSSQHGSIGEETSEAGSSGSSSSRNRTSARTRRQRETKRNQSGPRQGIPTGGRGRAGGRGGDGKGDGGRNRMKARKSCPELWIVRQPRCDSRCWQPCEVTHFLRSACTFFSLPRVGSHLGTFHPAYFVFSCPHFLNSGSGNESSDARRGMGTAVGERGRTNRSQTRVDRAASETEESGPKKRPDRLSSPTAIDGPPSKQVSCRLVCLLSLLLFGTQDNTRSGARCKNPSNGRSATKECLVVVTFVHPQICRIFVSIFALSCALVAGRPPLRPAIRYLSQLVAYGCFLSVSTCLLLGFRPVPAVDYRCRRHRALRLRHPRLAEDRRRRQEQQRQRHNSAEGEEEIKRWPQVGGITRGKINMIRLLIATFFRFWFKTNCEILFMRKTRTTAHACACRRWARTLRCVVALRTLTIGALSVRSGENRLSSYRVGNGTNVVGWSLQSLSFSGQLNTTYVTPIRSLPYSTAEGLVAVIHQQSSGCFSA